MTGVAKKTERLEFWTEVMRDREEATTTRLRASELLSKALDQPGDSDLLGDLDNPGLLSDAELAAMLSS